MKTLNYTQCKQIAGGNVKVSEQGNNNLSVIFGSNDVFTFQHGNIFFNLTTTGFSYVNLATGHGGWIGANPLGIGSHVIENIVISESNLANGAIHYFIIC